MDKTLGMLGLMRKAGAIEIGTDRAEEAIGKGRARLVLIPSDASERARRNAELLLRGKSAVEIELPYMSAEMADAVGTGRFSMAVVTDLGFADAFLKKLAESDPGKYGSISEEIARRTERARRRKTEKPGRKTERQEGER